MPLRSLKSLVEGLSDCLNGDIDPVWKYEKFADLLA